MDLLIRWFPCRGNAAAATVAANGTWTTGQNSGNLNGGTTYYAQAVQTSPSAKTSAAFTFVAP